MATESGTAPAAAAAPLGSVPSATAAANESQELLKQLDSSGREKEALLKKIEELSRPSEQQLENERLAKAWREEKLAKERAFQEEGMRKMQEVMAAQEEALGKSLSASYKEGLAPVFASAGFSEPAGIVSELSFVARNEKKKAAELAGQLAAVQEQLKAYQANEARFSESVKATHGTILGLQQQQAIAQPQTGQQLSNAVPTLASAFGQVYKVTAPNFSSEELDMLRLEGVSAKVAVNASAGGGAASVTVPALPVNASRSGIQEITQNSLLRRWPQTAGPWAWAMNNAGSTEQLAIKLHSTGYEEKRNLVDESLPNYK